MSQLKVFNISLNPDANVMDQWDIGSIKDTLDSLGATYSPIIEPCERGIVILPARHHKGLEQAINAELGKINKPILMLIGDEEAEFNVSEIDLDPAFIWVQNATPGKHDKYNKLGTGYPKHLNDNLEVYALDKSLDVFFSGQITHIRRQLLWDSLSLAEKDNWHINRTKGFTQGYEPKEYYSLMKKAKVVPCPSGAVVPDSFRAFEALECFAVPLLDDVNPSGTIDGGYWDWLLGDNPLPKYKNPSEVPTKIYEILADWDNISQKCISWYLQYKSNIKESIREQYYR